MNKFTLFKNFLSTKFVFTLLALMTIGVGNAWGKNTWIANVGVGSGVGSVYAEIYSDASWPFNGVQTTSETATNSTTKQAKWSSSANTTKGHCIFHATAGTGYSFSGWYTASDCSGSATSTGNPYSTTSEGKSGRTYTYTYYAKFTPINYTVKLNNQSATTAGTATVSVTFDATTNLTSAITCPTKNGYTFGGYYTATGGGGSQLITKDGTWIKSVTNYTGASGNNPTWVKADNVTLYAKWTANTYTVRFDGNGATSGSMDDQEFTYDVAQNLSAFTSFERVYTVSYNANGGTTTNNTSPAYTTATYSFDRWNTKSDGTGSYYTNKKSVSNLATSGTFTLYAQWKSGFVTLPNATKDGGVLDAWYLGETRIGAAGEHYTPTADVELTAHWINKYTPVFGGSDHSMEVGDNLTNAFTFEHTYNPTVHISPEGIISYNAQENKVTALAEGEATIYFEQAETSSLLYKKSDTWTFTVSRVENTLALTSTSASKCVDEEVTGVITTKNSDATVQTSSSDATIAYYDVDKNKIVIPNSSAKSFVNTTVTIKIWQNQTVKYKASGEKTFTLTVEKYPTSFTGSDYNLMVDGTQVANYVYTNTSAAQPTANSGDNFYYTIDEVSFTNSEKNKETDLLVFDPSNKQITAKNAGTAKITLHQKETYKYTGATKSFNVAVYKYNSVFANANNLDVTVEANATSPYTLTYTKPNNAYISTESFTEATPSLNNGEFYYTLTHNVTASNTTGSTDPTKAIEYIASEKKAIGKNEGTATIHLYQTETYKYNPADVDFIVTVKKNDPVFTWNKDNKEYFHNTEISNIFSSTNTDFAATIGASTDALVARVDGNTLHVLSKAGSYANFTVTQGANYKWNEKTETYTVTPTTQSNHVTLTYTQAMYNDGNITTQKESSAWDSNNGVRLGGSNTSITGAPAYNWDDKYIVICFSGIPDILSFSCKANNYKASDREWYVKESSNGSDWTDLWSNTSISDSWTNVTTNQLKSTSRYIKLCYSGNFAGYFKNIKVTELKAFAPNPTTLDFGTLDINTTGAATQKTFEFNYANVGHNVTLSTNDAHFTVDPTSITNIGGEKTGAVTIKVNYSTAEVHKATNAKMTITDELGNSTNVTLKGETKKLQPTINWSSDESIFIEEDVLKATNSNGLTVELSVAAADEKYVQCEGNTATILGTNDGTVNVTVTASVTGNAIYADATFTKDITITNLTKQTISWTQDLSHFKTTDATKSKTLDATASSGLAVTYELVGDATGLTLTQNGNTWTLTYSAQECKNTTLVAKQGGNSEYAPASSVSIPVRVIDPTKVCDDSETLVNSSITLKSSSVTYNIDIPESMKISLSRVKTGLLDVYLFGVDVEFYSGRNGTGTKLYTKSYSASDINKSISNASISLSSYIHAKSVKVVTDASNGYYLTSLRYDKRKYCNISDNSLSFSTYPNTVSSTKTFTVSYANYPISVECSNPKFTVSPTEFGDCDEYDTKTIPVYYTAGAAEGTDNGYIYIKDNTGETLKTCTLSVTIQKLTQSITNTNIQSSYLTTDKVTLSVTANSGLTDFTYSASPAGIASINGNELTFVKSGTIAITATQAGTDVYNPTSTTVNNIVVSKAEPTIVANPTTAASIVYKQTLPQNTLSGGKATVTLRGEADTEVAGTFSWTNPSQQILDKVGEHYYSVTFTPDIKDMYTTTTCSIPVTITRAEQSIQMNDGSVKVAVEGIDAGSADSKLDLDDLIKWQTSDVVNDVERTGNVSYKVIGNNDAVNIGIGNIFSATQTGVYTIRATKAETDYYSKATADFTVTVGKRANTLAIANTTYEKYVDAVVTGIRSEQNSDAQVKTSSTYPTIAYYDVESNEIRIPNSASDVQMFGDHKEVTIKIWQEETERFEASGEKVITLTVKKYVTSLTGSDKTIKVSATYLADYKFSSTSTPRPSNNPEDDFYYTIDAPNFENEALNNGNQLISYDPSRNHITGYNAGTTKITFFQKETYKYTGATLMCNVEVKKNANVIKNTWENSPWQRAMDENENLAVSFTSTLDDYTNYPINKEQIYGEDVAIMSETSIQTNTTHGYAIWHLSQAENYKYYAAEADLMVLVGVPAPPTCYVFEDYTEHEFTTSVLDAEGHFETPIAISSPIDKIWYSARKSDLGYNYFVVQYSTDNQKTWNPVSSPDLGSDYEEYSATFPTLSGSKKITHVRFGAKTGATLSKWYKDVRISRRAYLNILDAEQKNIISKLPTMECTIDETSTAEATFYIDYSTCDNEIIIESSNPEYFTVNRTKIDVNGDNFNSAQKEKVIVTYNSAELGTHSGVITIRTSYQTKVLSVSGVTSKRTPTLTWQEGYTNNPLTLPIGLIANAIKPAATSTSTASVMYESSNENVVQILEEGYAFKVVGLGSATLTATAPENDKWKSVSDTRVIHATEKKVQEIVWDQTFPRFMKPGDVIDLDAKVFLHNLSTESLTYSEERTQNLTYSCPLNNQIVSINGNQLSIMNYGEVKVTASVAGNADYEAATPVTILINVRQPSEGCETPLVFYKEDVIDMFEVNVDFSDYFNLTTQEMISDEIKIDRTKGKPDKLSFQYVGEEFTIATLKFLGGAIKFEQHVDKQWSPVEGSLVNPVKNEWKALSNLQLDENADALRIIREKGSTGHHKIKDIQVTRKQYLRATKDIINLGEFISGEVTPITIGFDYSDVKGDLTARTINNTTGLTIQNNGEIDLECGSFGHYDLPVTFTPDQAGEWKGTVEIYDNITNLSTTVVLKATVTANDEYVFEHPGDWSAPENWSTTLLPDEATNIRVKEDMTINISVGVKSITIEENVNVIVKSGVTLAIGDGSPKDREIYGNLYVEDGGKVTLSEGAKLRVNDFFLEAALGNSDNPASSGQVSGSAALQVNGNAYFDLALDPSGACSQGWYDFTVPFEVDALRGITRFDNTTGEEKTIKNEVNYAIMDYTESLRLETGYGWKKFRKIMQPGKCYAITIDDYDNVYRFKKVKGGSFYAQEYEALAYTDTDDANRGWNGLGNGTLAHVDLNTDGFNLEPNQTPKVQIYSHATNSFSPVEIDEYTYVVGSAYFIQAPNATSEVTYSKGTNDALHAPRRVAASTNSEFRLSLTNEKTSKQADRLYVGATDDALESYEIGRDLAKCGTPTDAKVAQVWVNAYGMKLCDVDMPLRNNGANCDLGIFAPQAGQYTFAVERAPEDATIFLTYNGRPIWNLSMSPYVFDLNKGTTDGYGLQMYIQNAPKVATGVDEVESTSIRGTKIIIDQTLYIITPEGAIYSATGKKIQ